MWSRRRKHIVYRATVFVLSLVLTLGLRTGQETSSLSYLPCLGTLLAFPLLTRPTLGALRSRGEKADLRIPAQFLMPAFYFVVNTLCVFRFHRPWLKMEKDRDIAVTLRLCYDVGSKWCRWADWASWSPACRMDYWLSIERRRCQDGWRIQVFVWAVEHSRGG